MIRKSSGYMTTPDGEDIWYEDIGEGPALVFAHGLGGNSTVWYQQVPYFAERYRVITWDQRGFGRSTNHRSQHGPAAAVQDQIALFDALNITQADCVGQSMGGWVALGTALAAPEKVRSVVLNCTTAGLITEVVSPASDADTHEDHSTLGSHPAVGTHLPKKDLSKAYLYQSLSTFGNRPSNEEFIRLLDETTYEKQAVATLQMPFLLISGEHDPLMPPTLIRDVAQQLTNHDLVEMKGCGHSPYFEQPDFWNQLVLNFIAGER